MIPVGKHITIEPKEEPVFIFREPSAYQHGIVKEISPDIQVPFLVGDTVVFIRGKKLPSDDIIYLNIEHIQLWKGTQQ